MMCRISMRVFVLVSLSALGGASDNVPARQTEQALKQHYDAFVASLNHRRLAEDYPEAVRNLDSTNPKQQITGIKTLAATDDIRAIPWIVPLLESEDGYVRIYAGQALNALVASHELKRRDETQPARVIIRPPGPGDTDISPMAWVILNMLGKPDDGNTHAFAANMIGYLRLDQFERDLRQLLKSQHPAVTRAARNALEMLGIEEPDAVCEAELEAARASIDVTRQANSKRFTEAYALIQQGEYEEALHLLDQNIAETPNAGNIDYSYAWGCVCAAHLGRLDKTLKYYRVMRTRFYGWLHLGANGANRKWDSQLEMVRRAVASGKQPEKEVVLKEMAAMDERARRLMLADLEQLALRAAGGDQVAILQLRQCPYGLVDLIVEGRFVPADSSGKICVDSNSQFHTLQGTVIEKPWTKSRESWNAGGSEYYVLDVGQGKLPQGSRSAKEGVILRPSQAVPFEQFKKFKGKRVVVKGRFVEAKPYKPVDPHEQIPGDHVEQYPMEPTVTVGPDGKPILGPSKPAPRGSGFQVYEIQPVPQADVAPKSNAAISTEQLRNSLKASKEELRRRDSGEGPRWTIPTDLLRKRVENDEGMLQTREAANTRPAPQSRQSQSDTLSAKQPLSLKLRPIEGSEFQFGHVASACFTVKNLSDKALNVGWIVPLTNRAEETLRGAVLNSLDYWLSHDFQNSNWWWNQIGVPRALLPTLLLMEEDLSPEQRSRAFTILRRAKIGMTGQNLVWVTEITAVRGILENDPELVAAAYRRIADEIRLSTGEGIQADFSFHQHGPCLYNHGYGAAFAGDCSEIATRVAGTRFAFPAEKISLLASLILDGSQWMTRDGVTDFGAEGREIARRGQSAHYLSMAARNMLQLPTGREVEFRELAARASGQPAPPLVGNRHFWCSDLMTHHRPGYYTSARMFSSRIANTDMPCNGEGLKSHHIADGCNVLLRTGREYQEIFPVWDWQKVPGTTVEQRPELTGSPRRMGKTSFVGGVSDGTYGVAAFELERDGLKARKSWFFFDDEYACLGAGITCDSDNPVVTTLNQCNLAGDVLVSKDGRVRKVDSEAESLDNPDWLWHDEVGYVLLGSGTVRLHHGAQRGSWWEINHEYSKDTVAREVFTACIDHGKRPQNAAYSYLVVPGIAADSLATYAGRSPVKVLRNGPGLQAVWHETLRIAGLAFYEPGEVEIRAGLTLGVDTPCLVVLMESPEKLVISISHPGNEQATVQVEVSRPLDGERVKVLDGPMRSRIMFDLPGGMEAGKSVTRAYAAR